MAVNPGPVRPGGIVVTDDSGDTQAISEQNMKAALTEFRLSTGRAMRYAVRRELERMGCGLSRILQAPVDALEADQDGKADHRTRIAASRLLLQASGVLSPDPMDEPVGEASVIDQEQDRPVDELVADYLKHARGAI